MRLSRREESQCQYAENADAQNLVVVTTTHQKSRIHVSNVVVLSHADVIIIRKNERG
jgi:hypothetical protein